MKNNNVIDQMLGNQAALFDKKLTMFSLSDQDKAFRRKAFANVIEQTMDINNMVMKDSNNRGRNTFAGATLSGANLAGQAIYAGIMRSYVTNISPIFSVQRSIDAPEQKIMIVDFYDLLNNELIAPNIGPDRAWADVQGRTTDTINPAVNYTITSGVPITPRTFRAEVFNNSDKVGEILDNGQGSFIATPGLIEANSSITYNTGGSATAIIIWATGLVANKIVYSAIYDQTGKDEINRGYSQVDYYDIQTSPILIPVERNVIADHAMQKQGILNADELFAEFVENEYTKVVNQRVFDALIQGYQGDTYKLDLSPYSINAGNHNAVVRAFKSLLTQAENVLAEQTYKTARVTGYLASPRSIDMFDLMNPAEGWVKNVDVTYFKDIAGWFLDVPVVRCPDLADGEILLTHRTKDGYVAPLYHGMFLAPTELPVVASYANMTKYTSGMYSMEGVGFSTSKLCVKVKVIPPSDLVLVKM